MNIYIIRVIAAIAVILLIILSVFLTFVLPYYETIGYIKTEIRRTKGRRKKHWKRELKKLYVSCIPLIGKYLAKRIK